VPFVLFPGQAIDYRTQVQVASARRWPTVLDRAQLLRLTGEKQLPAELESRLRDGRLDYFANGEVSYTIRGLHARLTALWNYEAPEGGGDTHRCVVRGARARVEILQGAEQKWLPELYLAPVMPAGKAALRAAVDVRLAALARTWPGLTVEDEGARLRIGIPARYRVGHEAHFAQVTQEFLAYLKNPASLPAWEKANMLAKYYVTSKAVELSRR
jgi:hypothetical protein